MLRAGGQHLTDRMAELQERIEVLKGQLRAVQEQLAERADQSADPAGVAQTLREFDGLWEQMKPREQEKFVKTLVEQVSYDGRTGTVTVGFRTGGIQQMCLDAREGKWSRN